MKVRCGSCRTEFEVSGPGRFPCPVCGSVNVVRDTAAAAKPEAPATPEGPSTPAEVGGYPAAPGVASPGVGTPPPPPPPQPDLPMPKIECPECGFKFIVGMIPVVTCPMCSTEVETGIEEDSTE